MRHDGSCSETDILSIGKSPHWSSTSKVEAKIVPFLAPYPVRGCNASLQRVFLHISGISRRTVMTRLYPRPRDFACVHEISWHQS
jgi:hypothetical protein